MFAHLYQKMMRWSRHKHAPYYLYSLSFAESSFFPIPPDIMLAPMSLSKPENAFSYAAYTTVSSVLGALLGYVIGFFFMHGLWPYLDKWGYVPKFLTAQTYFQHYGFWVMFMAGFGPIPYKIFTITGGAMKIALGPFIIGSLLGRGGRFFLVTGLVRWKGQVMEKIILKYIDRFGLALIAVGIISGIYYYF